MKSAFSVMGEMRKVLAAKPSISCDAAVKTVAMNNRVRKVNKNSWSVAFYLVRKEQQKKLNRIADELRSESLITVVNQEEIDREWMSIDDIRKFRATMDCGKPATKKPLFCMSHLVSASQFVRTIGGFDQSLAAIRDVQSCQITR